MCHSPHPDGVPHSSVCVGLVVAVFQGRQVSSTGGSVDWVQVEARRAQGRGVGVELDVSNAAVSISKCWLY